MKYLRIIIIVLILATIGAFIWFSAGSDPEALVIGGFILLFALVFILLTIRQRRKKLKILDEVLPYES